MVLIEKAYAKVNLILDVLNKRSDGYHNIGSVFHTLGLSDTLIGRRLSIPKIVLKVAGAEVTENQQDNLVYKAAAALQPLTPDLGVEIELQKTLPMGAGMGGGSADAAAALRLCNRLWGLCLPDEKLEEIGAVLGADVPFMVKGGCALAEGIGEKLIPLPKAEFFVMVITPRAFVSTPQAYAALKPVGEKRWNKVKETLLEDGFQWDSFTNYNMYNHFESSVLPRFPEIREIHAELKATEPHKVMLSGSGASIFALYNTEIELLEALKQVRVEHRYFSCTKMH